jgi:hypothetical protein
VFADAFILRSSSSGKTYLEYAQELIKIVKEDESRNTFVTDEFYMQAIAMVVQVYKAADVLDAKWEDGKIEWNVDGKFADARLQIIEYLRKHVDEDNKPTLEKILKI